MKTLKVLLVLGCLLGLELGSAFGQGDSFSCTQCICVADGSCDTESGCNGSDSDCEATSFTAACTGNYTMRYALDCSGATCAQCFACVFLTDESGTVLGQSICHGPCSNNNCIGDCGTVSLTANLDYKLHVCKRACGDGGSCSNCNSCIARGYVFIGGGFSTACSTIPACNP